MPIGSIGTDFIVNSTTANDQTEPTITTLTDGRIVVTWSSADTGDGSGFCVRGRVFFPDGSPAGNDFILNSTTSTNQVLPAVSALADGRFLVTWDSGDGGDGAAGFGIRGRLFEPDGSPVANDFVVNTTGAAGQSNSASAVLADGRFMVTWRSTEAGDGSGNTIRGRLFESDGSAVGNDFVVNSTGQGDQRDPAIAALSDGRFVAAWESADTGDGSGECVRIRLFNADGSPIANDIIVNSTTQGNQSDPAVTALTDGRFLVTWASADPGDGSGDCVRGRTFNADGSPDGNDFIINSTAPTNQVRPAITALADGRFVAVWSSGDGGDGSGFGIRARLFADNGNPLGDDFVVNTTGQNTQTAPAVTALADGRFVVTWQSSDTGDGSGLTVRARFFDPTVFFGTDAVTESWEGGKLADRIYGGGGIDLIAGREGNDVLSGDAGNDFLAGDAGDDILRGGTGADNMQGGEGSDIYFVDNTGDVVQESDVAGIDTVNASVTFSLSAQFIENLVLTGSANINARGNSLANTLTGNNGNNAINGATGADLMIGLRGDDTYTVDNAGDVVQEASGGGTDTVKSSVTFSLRGGHVEHLLLTGSANINGTGNSKDNQITGNTGNNVLNGWSGSDTLTGGGSSDVFVFDTALDAATNVDTITDFQIDIDKIRLDNDIFEAVGASLTASEFVANATGAATTGSQNIIYNTTDGRLFYDPDGTGAQASVHFATLAPGLALDLLDFVVV